MTVFHDSAFLKRTLRGRFREKELFYMVAKMY